MVDHRLNILEIAAELNFTYGTASRILHESLGLNKVWLRLVPRMLMGEHKKNCMKTLKGVLAKIQLKDGKFFELGLTGDGTCFCHCDPEWKQQSRNRSIFLH